MRMEHLQSASGTAVCERLKRRFSYSFTVQAELCFRLAEVFANPVPTLVSRSQRAEPVRVNMTRLTRISDAVFTVGDFFTPEKCAAYITLSEDAGYSDAPITTSWGPQHCPEIRNNTRVMIDDDARAHGIWDRARNFVTDWDENWSPVGLNERLRFYRYEVGQQFNWHYDGCYERLNGERSWLTFLIYLNSEFDGGQTVFEHTSVAPETGMALFFVHQLRHKGQAVTAGRKYVLRSDVMYRYKAS